MIKAGFKLRRHCVAFVGSVALSMSMLMPTAQAADGDVTEYKLNNGLRIVVKEDHRSPTVAHMVWYKAGSIDEYNGTTGVAHVLEHMMFKGTKNLKVGEFSQTVAALGGRDNAFTSRDYTAYFQQLQAKDLSKVMALEADRMANLVLSESEFKKEIQVVMEERRYRTDDQAQGKLYEAFMATAFQANPTRYPVIGWMSDLQAMTYKDARKWYDTWYAPQNAVLVVVGDVQPAQVKTMAEKTYGKVKPKQLEERKPQEEPKQEGIRRVQVKAPAENPYLIMGFKVPKLNDVLKDRDAYSLAVLSAVLDGYSGARLNRELVQNQKVALQAGASYDMTGRGPSLFYLDGAPAAGQTVENLEQALLAQVKKVADEGVSEAELARVKAQLIASQVYKRDSVYGQAVEIGQNVTIGFEVGDIDRMIEQIKTVTPQEVQYAAQKFFDPDQLTVGALYPLPIDPNKKNAPPKGLSH
ncbi:MAG: pitrilysin family protein [Limnobacter sp.]|uniref:M16 family metallopeptidase n=1 Tax=Limnobacter sp. TaxID=2003368 RepID=UPI0022BC8461|nr:pitrilysin family protein [Limnobacter sp.]MCZ8017023.1 pitrilysin family protein [Limnobacter sp.]